MTKVKICGITNLNDARISVESGADALGFNFYAKSPRYISPDTARAIVDGLQGEVLRVGVFVNEPIDSIVRIVDRSGLDAIQLHGDETPEFVGEVRKRLECAVIKAFRVSERFSPDEVARYDIESVLLDGFSETERGGTGETFDWSVAKNVSKLVDRLYLAGGLTVENIRAAISEVRPYAVDACSSLESAPGSKDAAKLRSFIMEAKRV